MPSRLPLVDAHEKEHTYCTFCPKLCRHACPVAIAEGRETTTPWGKMASLHHVAEGNLAHSGEVAATWWACTGCMRCKAFCDHGNEVAMALNAGRAEALSRGTAPRSARALREDHAAREDRAGAAARDIFEAAPERLGRRACSTAYAPGCTACVTAPEDARAGFAAVAGLIGESPTVLGGRCCGMPLLDAGDPEGFLRSARAFLDDAPDQIVFLDPGCLHALRVHAPSLDPAFPTEADGGPALLHLSELAGARLDALSPLAAGATPEGPVRYHDPCRLGRGLGVYDAPRAVLGRILGRPPEELHQAREHAECSGAGGQLPRTSAGTSQAIAEERRADHELAGGGVIVSPCPSSRRAFEKGGSETLSFAALVAAAVAPPPTEPHAEASNPALDGPDEAEKLPR